MPGSVNWPFSVIVSPSLAIVSDRLRSAAVNCGATLLTVTLADAVPTLPSSLVTEAIDRITAGRNPGGLFRYVWDVENVSSPGGRTIVVGGRAVAPVDRDRVGVDPAGAHDRSADA